MIPSGGVLFYGLGSGDYTELACELPIRVGICGERGQCCCCLTTWPFCHLKLCVAPASGRGPASAYCRMQ